MEELRSQQRRVLSKRDKTSPQKSPRFGGDYGATTNEHAAEHDELLSKKTSLPSRPSELKLSPDEFEDEADITNEMSHKITRTGRQRKKLAARTKGGEFQAKRRKKRIYFCCISSEIDLEKLQDAIRERAQSSSKYWETKMYEDAVHLYISDDLPSERTPDARRHSIDMGTSPPRIEEPYQGYSRMNEPIKRMSSADGPATDMALEATPKLYQSAAHLWAGGRISFQNYYYYSYSLNWEKWSGVGYDLLNLLLVCCVVCL